MNTRFNFITLAVIVGLVAVLLAGAGITGAAAQAAIPGDALYTVKTGIEQTRLALANDAGDRAQMKMAFAEQRLNEISALIEEGRYREINDAVLAFESGINGAILELQTLSQVDPLRSARLAQEITSTLTRYAQTLSTLVASAPADVLNEVNRALTSTNTASSLELPDGSLDDNSNGNANDDDSNDNANINDDSNANSNDDAGDDDNSNSSNDNGDDNSNDDAGDDDNSNSSNDNGDDNSNGNAGDDDNSNSSNDNGDDNGNDDAGDDDNSNSSNDNGDDNGNDNSGDDNSNSSNDNGDDNGNSDDNSGDDNGNDNGNSNSNDNSGG